MAASLIAETPVLSWPAGQDQTVKVTPTLPSGRALADWSSFVLTVREDPLYPRAGAAAAAAAAADPHADGWAVEVTAAGSAAAGVVTFTLTVPDAAGFRRYALDVWAVGGTPGDVQLVAATWLTVTPSVR